MHLNSDSFRDSVQTWMEVIGHLWAELGFWLFMRKRVKMSAAADISMDADILAGFGQVVPVQPAVPVRETRRPYKLGGFVSRCHLGTARTRGNTFREEIFSRTERRAEWRVYRAQIVRSLDAYLNCRPPTFQPLSYLMFYIMRRRHVWQGANISCRRIYFVYFSCFLDLEYFRSANILIDADILGRRHFA